MLINFYLFYYEGFSGYQSYGNAIIFKNISDNNEIIGREQVSANALEPYCSNVLVREKEK